jgi:hypothetical protein
MGVLFLEKGRRQISCSLLQRKMEDGNGYKYLKETQDEIRIEDGNGCIRGGPALPFSLHYIYHSLLFSLPLSFPTATMGVLFLGKGRRQISYSLLEDGNGY